MPNQFIVPTWLIVGLPSLILLVILVWFAVVWWRARRDDAAYDIDVRCERPVCCGRSCWCFHGNAIRCLRCGAVFEHIRGAWIRCPVGGEAEVASRAALAEHERAMRRIAAMCRSARSAGITGQNWREN